MNGAVIDNRSLQSILDDARQRHRVVGAALGIVRDGKIASVASGFVNASTAVPATPDTVFQIGSIGKVFTATLMMQLADEGRLDLDGPVKSYLPDFVIADRDAAARITLRELLCHTSGMDGEFYPADDPDGPSTESYVRKMCLLPQIHPVGAHMSYCNSGYVVAGRVIEVLTNRPWASAIMQRICQPLGMTHAFAHPHESLRYRCAMGHVPDPQAPERHVPASQTFLCMSAAPAGAVLSMSAPDLLRFVRCHMADGELGGGERMISSASARAMRAPQVELPPFSSSVYHKWGLGWGLGYHRSCQLVGHDGATIGQFAHLRCFPQQQVAFVLLTNSASLPMWAELEEQLLADLLGAHLDPAPAGAPFQPRLDRYVGTYQNLDSRASLRIDGEHLLLTTHNACDDEPPTEERLVPYAPDCFDCRSERPERRVKVFFVGADANGRAEFMRMSLRMLPRLRSSA